MTIKSIVVLVLLILGTGIGCANLGEKIQSAGKTLTDGLENVKTGLTSLSTDLKKLKSKQSLAKTQTKTSNRTSRTNNNHGDRSCFDGRGMSKEAIDNFWKLNPNYCDDSDKHLTNSGLMTQEQERKRSDELTGKNREVLNREGKDIFDVCAMMEETSKTESLSKYDRERLKNADCNETQNELNELFDSLK
ncbi:membrane or secreted protein [Beggiatoa sp. PS]|nr:membrane or secreted protein [Beggiatoa sp. PS]